MSTLGVGIFGIGGKMGSEVRRAVTAAEDMEVTGPGTAPTCLPSSRARCAVDRAPERQAASTTIVAPEIAAMTRLRETNR